eukprot:6175660-Pleurochrysis_carterae.AAC.1
MITPKGKHVLRTRARHGHAVHASAQLVGDLLGSADTAEKKLSRVVAHRSCYCLEGRRQQARLDDRRSSGHLADAGEFESCSASPGGQLLLALALDDEIEAAVDPGRTRRFDGCIEESKRGRPHRRQHIGDVRAGADMAHSSIQSEDSQTRFIASTAAMMSSEPKPVRITLRSFLPASAPRSASSPR